MTFETIEALSRRLRELGASRIIFKLLSENDNSKQQVYVGGSFDVLRLIPHGEIRAFPGAARPNYKARVSLSWIDSDGRVEPAPGAQLILYPDYPEVRLSGFLRGCAIAPNDLMRSLPRRSGRVLFLGISLSGRLFAYTADESSHLASEAHAYQARGPIEGAPTIFHEISISRISIDPRRDLLDRLWSLHRQGWIVGGRLDPQGTRQPCNAPNCGGYTLEASFGIIPNGRSEPDYRGWELKAHSPNGRITLMTPQPTLGYYGEFGTEAFVRRYGRKTGSGDLYFTGQHIVGVRNNTSNMTLRMRGYDRASSPRGQVDGALYLCGPNEEIAAGWRFTDLLALWSRKHANAAYVPYEMRKHFHREYRFGREIRLGVGASFENFLAGLASGAVRYDPGPKIEVHDNGRKRVKARSQFRTIYSRLPSLYVGIEDVVLPI